MMRLRLSFLLLLALLALPSAAYAEPRAINVPRGTLVQSLPLLGRQAGISISVADPRLWQMPVKPVRGTMEPGQALVQMLAGTEARAVRVSATSWRIERRPVAPKPVRPKPKPLPKPAPPPPAQAPPPQEIPVEPPGPDIIVTATKAATPYAKYAGVATLLEGGDLAFGGERGMDSILSRMASVSSTHLGSGRNKLFIRGIADSSFTGPTQATVGQYLGDTRLSYNAPDPDLRLYDMERVEVLEGPQGTLYGAGSMGGIIRMMPNAPTPAAFSLNASAGITATQHGKPGGDIAATANIPLGDDGHALRLVGYAISDGGYIDNPMLGQHDVNRTHIRGGRAALRLDLGGDWSADLGGIYQTIKADDAQYADRDAPALTHNSRVEQGAKARYGAATLVVSKEWDDLHLQSSNAYVDHRLDERYDASLAPDRPRVFDQDNDTRMIASETRLSRPFRDGLGWVVGVSFIDNRTRQTRAFGQELFRVPVTGVTNRITEYTGYGEVTVELLDKVVATAGLRYTHARLGGAGEDVAPAIAIARQAITAKRTERDLLPSASLLASLTDNVTLYARYQEGFRPGGLSIDGNFVQHFKNDHVSTYEAGARFGRKGVTPFDAVLSISHSRWRDIQADFIDANGFPTTANIGDGKITSISGALAMRPFNGLSIELGAVYNKSRVTNISPTLNLAPVRFGGTFASDAAPVIVTDIDRLGRVPNVASHAVRGSVSYTTFLGDQDFKVRGWANYIGPSRLGIGPVLGEGQGDYVDTGLAARIGNDRRGLTFTLTNLFDARGNRFALGTPFVPDSAGYLTPLRPRTIRIGIDVSY